MDKDKIDQIYEFIIRLAGGDLSQRMSLYGEYDELDAIVEGINMLAEELQTTTVSKDYLDSIYRGMVDMMVVLDVRFRIEQVNEVVCQQLHYQQGELRGRPFRALLPRGQAALVAQFQQELLSTGPRQDVETHFRTRTRQEIPVSLTGAKIFDNTGAWRGVLVVAKDISRLKDTELRLRTRNRDLSTLLYRASHDLKGPLASVAGLLPLARQEADRPGAILQYIDLIDLTVQQLDRTLEGILALARVMRDTSAAVPLNLRPLIEAELAHYRAQFPNVQFRQRLVSTDGYQSYPLLWKTVVSQLIDNAARSFDAAAGRPTVFVHLIRTPDEMRLTLRDNGVGIDPSLHERVFEMFFRATSRYAGSGLGLHLVRASVDRLRGQVTVKSEPDVGTTITVRVPH